MLPPKKKPGLDVMIAVGKPKPKPDLGMPDPLDKMMSKSAPSQEHEDAETPEYEASEETGAKLLNDIMAPLTSAGLSEADAKSTLADIFDALGKCLREDYGGGDEESGESAPDDEGAEGEGYR